MARIRSDLQIEKGLPAGNKILAKPDGQTEVVQIEPYKVSPTTWIVDDAGVYENTPGQFDIPSLPYGKGIDVAITNTHKVYKYNDSGGYWELQTNILPPPDLQAVTDVGNVTTNPVKFKNAFGANYNTYEVEHLFSGQTSESGIVVITFPNTPNTMLRMEVSLHGWSGVRKMNWTFYIKGYTRLADPSWNTVSLSVAKVGSGEGEAPPVRFANDANGDRVILIGDQNINWIHYTHVSISKIESVWGDNIENVSLSIASDDSEFTHIQSVASNQNMDVDLLDGMHASDFATASQGSLADSAVQPGDLATVATTGSSTDLSDASDIVRNNADSYPSEQKINQIVTLTQAEYDAIVTKDPNTMYVIPEI